MTQSVSNRYVYDGYDRRVKTTDSYTQNKGTSFSMYSQAGKLLYRETPDGGINYIFLDDKLIAQEGYGVKVNTDSIMHYKPFGESIETPKDDVGYTGHKFDTDLGLSYMQARYYDPVIGRFYSNDPVDAAEFISNGDIQGFGRYTYAFNNPYKYTDPDGKNPKIDRRIKPIAKAVAEAIGGKNAAAKVEARFTLMNPNASAKQMQAALNVVRNKPKVTQQTVGKNRAGDTRVKQTLSDGSKKDITPDRVKEFVPNTHPKAPAGAMQKVKFPNAQPGTKGYKRDPTPKELQTLKDAK